MSEEKEELCPTRNCVSESICPILLGCVEQEERTLIGLVEGLRCRPGKEKGQPIS